MWTQTGTFSRQAAARTAGLARALPPNVADARRRGGRAGDAGRAEAARETPGGGTVGATRRAPPRLAGTPTRLGEVLGGATVLATFLVLWTAFFAAVARAPAPPPPPAHVAAPLAAGR